MNLTSHLILGTASWYTFALQFPGVVGPDAVVLGSIALAGGAFLPVLAGSVLPDIDHPGSFLGKQDILAPASYLARKGFGHRGALHSFLFVALAYVGALALTHDDYLISRAFAWGYLSHILLDCLTVQGVPLFYPLSEKYSFGLVHTGKPSEMLATAIIFSLCAIVAYSKLR